MPRLGSSKAGCRYDARSNPLLEAPPDLGRTQPDAAIGEPGGEAGRPRLPHVEDFRSVARGYSLVVVPRTANPPPALVGALEQAGVAARWLKDDTVEIAGTPFVVVQVKVVRKSDAVLLVHFHDKDAGLPTIVVADRISEAARAELSRAGMAWLDRRGQLWIRTEGLFVNAAVPASTAPAHRRVAEVFRGAGLDVTLALLASPDVSHGVHELARQTDRSPGRVSEILSALRSQGLVGTENRPKVPELFWAVAEEWKPHWTPMAAAPPHEPSERYRLSGALGASALAAPVASIEGTWPMLYVADDADLSIVLSAFGGTLGGTRSKVAVCPSRYGFTWGSTEHGDGYLVANHLVVALDLAQDPAGGHEVLERWKPRGIARVW